MIQVSTKTFRFSRTKGKISNCFRKNTAVLTISFSVSLADPMHLVHGWERQRGAERMGILLTEKRYGAVGEGGPAGEEVRAKPLLWAGEMGGQGAKLVLPPREDSEERTEIFGVLLSILST